VAIFALLGGTWSPSRAPADEPPWIDLFDGSTLNGWTQRGGQAKYEVVEGTIVGTAVPFTPNSFLCTDQEYGDFELQLEFQIDAELNSGIQIRSHSRPDYQAGVVHGYQVEIDPTPREWTGGIYEESTERRWLYDLSHNEAARGALKPHDWNQLRIVAKGDSLKTWLNGVPAADLVDGRSARGFIALQVHSIGSRTDAPQVRWRKIRLRDLSGLGAETEPAGGPPATRTDPPPSEGPVDE
jgi:hypothetical protein